MHSRSSDAEYFAALRVMQSRKGLTGGKGPTQDDYDKAIATLKRIEKEKGLKGFIGLRGANE
jgi:tryptophan synthase alpha subunit